MKSRTRSILDRYIEVANSAARLAGAFQGGTARNPIESRLRQALKDIAHEADQEHLSWGTTGRISGLLGTRHFLISKGDAAFRSMGVDDFDLLDLDGFQPNDGFSGSPYLHRAIYLAQPDARAVLQVQPPFTTVLSAQEKVRPLAVPEIQAYWSAVTQVDSPASDGQALAAAVVGACHASSTILLKRGGVICWSNSISELMSLARTVEAVSRMLCLHLTVSSAGPDHPHFD